MSENKPDSAAGSLDPADDASEWTEAMFEIAELRVGSKVVRPTTGYLGSNSIVRGRPPLCDRAKQQVTLRLDPDVIERFRADGPGWQGRMNAALRKVGRALKICLKRFSWQYRWRRFCLRDGHCQSSAK